MAQAEKLIGLFVGLDKVGSEDKRLGKPLKAQRQALPVSLLHPTQTWTMRPVHQGGRAGTELPPT